jgi:hypothetical protein
MSGCHQPYREAGKQNTAENQSLREVQHDQVSVPLKIILLILAETALKCKSQGTVGSEQ